jgi:hypothetical protein
VSFNGGVNWGGAGAGTELSDVGLVYVFTLPERVVSVFPSVLLGADDSQQQQQQQQQQPRLATLSVANIVSSPSVRCRFVLSSGAAGAAAAADASAATTFVVAPAWIDAGTPSSVVCPLPLLPPALTFSGARLWVAVSNNGASWSAPGPFITLLPPPVLLSASPDPPLGPLTGGTRVTLLLQRLPPQPTLPALQCRWNGTAVTAAAATPVAASAAAQQQQQQQPLYYVLQCASPPVRAAGSVALEVSVNGGSSYLAVNGSFTYAPPLQLQSVFPDLLSVDAGAQQQWLYVTGAGFSLGARAPALPGAPAAAAPLCYFFTPPGAPPPALLLTTPALAINDTALTCPAPPPAALNASALLLSVSREGQHWAAAHLPLRTYGAVTLVALAAEAVSEAYTDAALTPRSVRVGNATPGFAFSQRIAVYGAGFLPSAYLVAQLTALPAALPAPPAPPAPASPPAPAAPGWKSGQPRLTRMDPCFSRQLISSRAFLLSMLVQLSSA